jgi:tRNA dimethylallyltransferase
MNDNKILIICGPTASGKTALSVECAKLLNSEIISADSLLIYKNLNIGTAKPTDEEKRGVQHHLIDVVAADKNFSVSDYENLAIPIIDNLLLNGKTPIVCGGTGFYVDSILYKRQFGNIGSDNNIRMKYEKLLLEYDNQYLYNILQEKDFETAKLLHPNDIKRIIRALEIYEITGKKKSEQKDELMPRYNYLAVMIDYDRETLYNRINKRVDIMLSNGLIDEVEKLVDSGITIKNQSMQGIGYKEVLEYLKNDINYSTMSDIIKKNSRNFAKRQITYFKKLSNLLKIPPKNDINIMAKTVISLL